MPRKKKIPKRRTIQLVRTPAIDGVGIFQIIIGSKASLYAFHEIRCDIGGRGFALHRLGLGNLYYARVGRPEDCSCECLGFLRHGSCKHIEGLTALIGRGEI